MSLIATLLTASSLVATVLGQAAGSSTAESHPKLSVSKCTKSGCTKTTQSVVLDSNWRWTHNTGGYVNCYDGNKWNATLCPDGATCVKNCVLEGADYASTYGISTSGDALTLKFVTKGTYGNNVGSRVYLMDSSDKGYEMFKLVNKEFTFDVDVSKLPCGLNGALYFSEMLSDGGASKYSAMKAGAKYGMGYCDAQCPRDIKWLAGDANVEGWSGSANDANSGKGKYGSCCNEMDIWEANSQATAYTPHPCSKDGPYKCTDGTDCDKICDQPGCDYNSWRMGDKTFYGPGLTVDSSKKMTVVTQFINDASGTLTEIRRKYVQNGKVIENSATTIAGLSGDSITDDWCAAQKTAFEDTNVFKSLGGLKVMGGALTRGMVLVMSIWDDYTAKMLWLNSDYPVGADTTKPGVNRGPCSNDSGDPKDVEASGASSQVIFSNIKWGELDSTYTK